MEATNWKQALNMQGFLPEEMKEVRETPRKTQK